MKWDSAIYVIITTPDALPRLQSTCTEKKHNFDGVTFHDNGEPETFCVFCNIMFLTENFSFIIHILFLLCHYQKTDKTTVWFREKCFIHKKFLVSPEKKNTANCFKRFHICGNKRNSNSYECDIKTTRALRICVNAQAKESFI